MLDCHLWCERMLITENHKFTLFLVIGFVLLGLVFCIVIWELLFVFIFLLLGFHFVFVFSILSLSLRNSVLVSMTTDNCLFDNFTKSREYIMHHLLLINLLCSYNFNSPQRSSMTTYCTSFIHYSTEIIQQKKMLIFR